MHVLLAGGGLQSRQTEDPWKRGVSQPHSPRADRRLGLSPCSREPRLLQHMQLIAFYFQARVSWGSDHCWGCVTDCSLPSKEGRVNDAAIGCHFPDPNSPKPLLKSRVEPKVPFSWVWCQFWSSDEKLDVSPLPVTLQIMRQCSGSIWDGDLLSVTALWPNTCESGKIIITYKYVKTYIPRGQTGIV